MEKTLSIKEIKTKEILEDRFIPSLHEILSSKNPKEYERWSKNACRQTAIYGAYFLEELLPEYTWSVWDGIFDDVVHGREVRYNHAWIFGVNRKEGRKLLIDLSRLHHERVFELTDRNRYRKEDTYINMVEVQRVQLDWKKTLREDKEYYTTYTGDQMIKELIKRMIEIE